MVTPGFTVHAFELALGRTMRGYVSGGRSIHGHGTPRESCRGSGWEGGIAIETGGHGWHVWTVEADAGGSDHLRTEGARGGAGQAAISRVLNAVDDGGLTMVAVGGTLGVDDSFNHAADGASRVRPVDAGGVQCRRQLGDLFGGRVSRMRRSMGNGRVEDGGTQGSVPAALIFLLVES